MKKSKISKLLGGMLLATSLILASSITVQAEVQVINKYDFNNDGVLDSKDVAILKTALLNLTKDVKYDVNGDGKVNILDYRALTTGNSYKIYSRVIGVEKITISIPVGEVGTLGLVGTLPMGSGDVGIIAPPTETVPLIGTAPKSGIIVIP